MNLSASPIRAVLQEKMVLSCGGGWQGCARDLVSVAGVWALSQDMTQPSAPLDEPGKTSLRQRLDDAVPQSTGVGPKAVQECVHMGKVPRLRDPELLTVVQLWLEQKSHGSHLSQVQHGWNQREWPLGLIPHKWQCQSCLLTAWILLTSPVFLSYPKGFRELKNQNNHSGCKVTGS